MHHFIKLEKYTSTQLRGSKAVRVPAPSGTQNLTEGSDEEELKPYFPYIILTDRSTEVLLLYRIPLDFNTISD